MEPWVPICQSYYLWVQLRLKLPEQCLILWVTTGWSTWLDFYICLSPLRAHLIYRYCSLECRCQWLCYYICALFILLNVLYQGLSQRHLLELSTLTLIFFPLSLGASALPFGGGGSWVCVWFWEFQFTSGMFAERMLILVCLHFLYIEIFIIFIPLELMYV